MYNYGKLQIFISSTLENTDLYKWNVRRNTNSIHVHLCLNFDHTWIFNVSRMFCKTVLVIVKLSIWKYIKIFVNQLIYSVYLLAEHLVLYIQMAQDLNRSFVEVQLICFWPLSLWLPYTKTSLFLYNILLFQP